MAVAGGTAYRGRDGWVQFRAFYAELWHAYGARLIIGGCIAGFVLAVILYGRKHGFGGVLSVILVFTILAVLAGMMLPALSKAKAKAQRISSLNNLKQIGLAATIFASDNEGRMPATFEEMLKELSTTKVLIDPESGQRYTYVGAGKSRDDPHAILAYSPERAGGAREVLFADGSVQQMQANAFAEALAKDGIEAEVIDLRTIRPMDTATIIESVKKTNRCVTVEEGFPQCSVGNYITSVLMKEAFDYLDGPVTRLAGPDSPASPNALSLEDAFMLSPAKIAAAIRKLAAY